MLYSSIRNNLYSICITAEGEIPKPQTSPNFYLFKVLFFSGKKFSTLLGYFSTRHEELTEYEENEQSSYISERICWFYKLVNSTDYC